ncbi:MAG: biopolymer transporter ExbD [Pirellulales bacterium]|jgi:biopolymer transport protein ExbD
MANDSFWNMQPSDEEESSALPRRPLRQATDIDMTPMIDLTFLLLIFFLVGSRPDMQTAVELPPARYGKGVSPRTSVIVTLAERGGPGPALVYLADGKVGTPLSADPVIEESAIVKAVEQGLREGKPTVLIKAEKGVRHREVARVAEAASRVEGIKLHLAVFEVQ